MNARRSPSWPARLADWDSLGQTVLLKGVNDNVATMKDLVHRLVMMRSGRTTFTSATRFPARRISARRSAKA